MSSARMDSDGSGVALCLGSSFFGFYAHAGFLEALVERGVVPQQVAGCSSGAVVGGLYSAGMSPREIREHLVSADFLGMLFEWKIPLRGCAMLVNFPGITGLISGAKAVRCLRKTVGDRRIEDATHPRFSVAVTDLSLRESKMLDRGPLAEAIVASCAIPILFKAVNVEGKYCWDGGLANSLPIEHLSADPGIHTVIVHHVVHRNESRVRGLKVAPSIAQAFNIAHQVIYEKVYRLSREKLGACDQRIIHCETHTSMPPVFKRGRESHVEAGFLTATKHRREWDSLASGNVCGEGHAALEKLYT